MAAKAASVRTTAIISMSNGLGIPEGSARDKATQMGCHASADICRDRGTDRNIVVPSMS